ncbi:MAG: phosphatase PAP2 family protein [Bacteriovoracaceae bacterium]|nr:phosphatase PAP2 family protein [Bacteriovoracaceae bacterium]
MNLAVKLDYILMELINVDWTAPVLDSFFVYWTDVQKTPLFQLGIVPLILFVMIRRRGALIGITLFLITIILTMLCDFINSELLKEFFQRARPDAVALPFELQSHGVRYGGFSFPSSHAADSFCLTTFISLYFPKMAPYVLIMAFLNAYSRVYIGVHFPFDVLAGAVFGASLAYVASKLLSLIKGLK